MKNCFGFISTVAICIGLLPAGVLAVTEVTHTASVTYTLETPDTSYIKKYFNTDIAVREYSHKIDVNQDGFFDVLLEEGILFGSDSLQSAYSHDDLNTRILQSENLDGSGEHMYEDIRFLADVNGDTFADNILANGKIYFGSEQQSGDIFTDMQAPNVTFTHEETQRKEYNDFAEVVPIATADINGDGISDLFIRVLVADDESAHRYVGLFIVYGSTTLPSTIELSTDADGYIELGKNSYIEVLNLGDVNNDGYEDVGMIVSQNGARPKYMRIYFGRRRFVKRFQGTLPKTPVRIQIPPVSSTSEAGKITAAGDVNGDGFDDLMMSNPVADRSAVTDAGKVFIFFGKKSFHKRTRKLTSANIVLKGELKNSYAGIDIAHIGDVNADGIDDLLIGFGTNGLYVDDADRFAYIVWGNKNWNRNQHKNIVLSSDTYIQLSMLSEIFATSVGNINGIPGDEFVVYNSIYEHNEGKSYILTYTDLPTQE